MDYLPFSAMVVAIAAGLAGLAARLALPERIRDAGMVVAILGATVIAFGANLSGPLHERLFGPGPEGTASGGGFLSDIRDGFSEGYAGTTAEPSIDQIKAEIRAQNVDWLFDGDADLESFARQLIAEAGNDRQKIAQASARLANERAKVRMRLLHQAGLAEVTRVINSMIESLGYFIDNAQFENCRTFLLGGYSYPTADPQIMVRLAKSLGAAVRSGQRGEKDWVMLSAADLDAHTEGAVKHLLQNGYTAEKLGSMGRLDTTDLAEMESNCRFTRDLFAHLVNEFPPEVAASIYVADL